MSVDFGAAHVVVRRGGLSARLHLRTLVACLALTAALAAAAIVALSLGDLPLSPAEVVTALFGADDGFAGTVVREWRLPRTTAAVLFGLALGVSGAVLQTLTANPLASPDVVGISSGSYAGGLVVIVLLGGGFTATAMGSLIGGLATAIAVYLLAYRRGVQGFRLIIVGIGLGAMLSALSTYLLLRARVEVAMTATAWGAGSLTPVGWPQLLPAAAVIAAALILLVVLSRPLHQLELGDDASHALGVAVERSRLALLVCAVALTAVVTAAAGPIAFVSLAAPQIARRLTGGAGISLAAAGLVGALLLTVSDTVAQHALPVPFPVGVVTVVIGGCYLVWLLVREARRTA
ncbi:FecCD family ABC transporter permease [Jiangella anatolica]|uniref:Iron ABC transporter permease n=1 Tax=Jiangella anatolica TaxID=2670374 RepID=A0A2W2BHX2_9ACTN|nr:iron chelate uptake ABC transporter family permease subunit [Jiangella anatolica]PZF84840.1 iron ABC transporter permease [Jiangella anatolica]